MKKIVLKLDLHDDRQKRKALKAVSSLIGIDSIDMNMEDKKLTVTGTVDPVDVVGKLSKFWRTEILTIGPAKEEKKEEKEEKKPDPIIPPMLTYYPLPLIEEYPNSSCVIC